MNKDRIVEKGVVALPRYVWGVDSSSRVTANLLDCVKEYYGTPTFWGRYLSTVPNVADGLTKNEIL